MAKLIPIRNRKTSEDGYMLIAVMFLLFLLVLSLSIAMPLIAKSIQRDREVEAMERGKQYSRAIQLYFRKFGAYPPNIEALVKTNNIRFLRKRYIDPLTGKDDWKPIMFGQNKAPLAMGFFGEPLAGLAGASPIAGTGPSGGNNAGTGLGGSTGGAILPGGIGSLFGAPTSNPQQNPNSGSTAGASSSPTGASGASSGQSGSTGSTTGTSSGSGSGSSTFGGGQSGQTFGGAGIVGFEPPSTRQSILTYKKKDHYNEWEFTYSPIQDQQKQIGGNRGTIGQPIGSPTGQPGSPGFGPGLGSGATNTPNTPGSPGASGTPTPQNQP